MSTRRTLIAGLGLSLLAPLVAPSGAGAVTPVNPTVVSAGAYLIGQQKADGGFEQTDFAGFETPDAILALAESSQGGSTWDATFARTGLADVRFGASGTGKNPLGYVDALVESGDTTTVSSAVQAAKVIALVATPLAIDPTDFDPADNSAARVDLVARIQAKVQTDGTLGFGSFFNGVLYTAIGFSKAGQPLPTGVLGQIRKAQRSDGSWNFSGDQDAKTPGDVDTTSTALLALAVNGSDPTDANVAAGIAYLAKSQAMSGAWQSFGTDDPNSTAVAVVALSALHIDASTNAWRARYGTGTQTSQANRSPYAWLVSQQAGDGHITSPNDAFPPVNTFATSQSVQALARQWFLSADREKLVVELATLLGSPIAAPNNKSLGVASDGLGANASIEAARRLAAANVLGSSFGREAAVDDLFRQSLGRAVDPSGRAYWSEKLKSITRSQVLSRITGSSEFYRTSGGTPETFVKAVYQAVLGRQPDAAGATFWTGRITRGERVEHVAQSLVASTEFRREATTAAYKRVLGRDADASGLGYWTRKLSSVRIEVLLSSLAATDEYYERATANS